MTRTPVSGIRFPSTFLKADLSEIECPVCGNKDVFADESGYFTYLICNSNNKVIQ